MTDKDKCPWCGEVAEILNPFLRVEEHTAQPWRYDRAWRFEGTFPSTEDIKAFKPWNKR